MKTTLALSLGSLLALAACGASSDGEPGNAPEHSTGGGGANSGGSGAGAVAGNTPRSGGSSGSGGNGGTVVSTAGASGAGAVGGNSGAAGVAGSGADAADGQPDSGASEAAADRGAAGQGGMQRTDAAGTTRLDAGPEAGGATRADAGTDGPVTPRADGAVGTPGLGPWTTGYVATMYGNNMSGDCAGYPSFSDMTAIRTSTCSRVVTAANFAAGVANNASFYGATGDVSSLWTGAACSCNGSDTCTGTQTPSCPAEQQAGGNCGICVAVRCDATGTFALSGSTHNQDCNATSFAVVQILDACPHNHPTNIASVAGWCTSRQANHIDLSCSALGGISTLGMNIGRDGWLNVAVQRVDCSIGLGLHPL